MTTPYEIEIVETRTVITRCVVEADSRSQAEAKALKGDTLLKGQPRMLDDPADRVVDTCARIERGSSLKRVRNALAKPHAFTVHARVWTPEGLVPEREYAVLKVERQGRDEGIVLRAFPEGAEGEERFVPASAIFGLRIESESDEISYEVTDISYDTDGETAILDLPEELEIDLPADTDPGDVEELLGEAITERTGWCHKGFDYRLAA